MVIKNNIGALRTNAALSFNNSKMNAALTKLSTGSRLTRASDDAAGLSISNKMKALIGGLNKAQDNVDGGVSMLQTADGALSEAQNILQRLNELAVQAQNGTLADSDKSDLQDEADQLQQSFNSIVSGTRFNSASVFGNAEEDQLFYKSGMLVQSGAGAGQSTNLNLNNIVSAQWIGVQDKLGGSSFQSGDELQLLTAVEVKNHDICQPCNYTPPNWGTGVDLFHSNGVNLSGIQYAIQNINGDYVQNITGRYVNQFSATSVTMPFEVTDSNGNVLTNSQCITQLGFSPIGSVNASGNLSISSDNISDTSLFESQFPAGYINLGTIPDNTSTVSATVTAADGNAYTITALPQYGVNTSLGIKPWCYDCSISSSVTFQLGNATTDNVADFEQSMAGTIPGKLTFDTSTNPPTPSLCMADGYNSVQVIALGVQQQVKVGSNQFTVHYNNYSIDTDLSGPAGSGVELTGPEFENNAENVDCFLTDQFGNTVKAAGFNEDENYTGVTGLFTFSGTFGFQSDYTVGLSKPSPVYLTIGKGAQGENGDSRNLSIDAADVTALGTAFTDSGKVFTLSITSPNSIDLIKTALAGISAFRSRLGALQNGLASASNALTTESQNLTAADSHIADSDMAQETLDFTKYQVLSQSTQAMLAQANGLSQGVLKLLGQLAS